jgi:hypothetical protein
MKKTLLLILIFSAGFLVGKLTSTPKTTTIESQLPDIEKKAFLIADKELRNYALAVEARDKLKAADELYGKILLLFLADLNLRLDLPQEPKETKWSEPIVSSIDTDKTSVPREGELEPSPFSQLKKTTHELREKFEQMEMKSEKQKHLSDLKKVENYKLAKYSSKITKEVKKMLGEFKGNLKLESGKNKGKIHTIHLIFDFVMNNKKLEGHSTIEFMNEKGEIYSSSSGEGSNQSLLQSKDNPHLVFIHCSPNSFLSINLENFPPIIAEYFEEDEFRGKVNLKKINP